MKKILMFVNPRSRQGAKAIESVEKWLAEHGYQILNPGFDPEKDDMVRIMKDQRDTCEAALVGGGDGSVNHALPGLMDTGLPLLLIPLGTANNLARTLQIPGTVEQALALLETGRITEVDVGIANDIPFMNVIGLGLSTQVNRLTRGQNKRLFGVFAFVWTALKVALRMTPFRVWINCGDKAHSARTWQISVCNGRNYGSGLTIHEDATLSDGTLHGLSTEVQKWWHVFRMIPSLMLGRFRAEQDVTTFEGTELEIKTRHPMQVDVDGDIKTRTPVKVTVKRKALRIYAPMPEAKL